MPRHTLLVPAAALALLIGLANFAIRADPPAAPASASAPGAKDALSRRDALLAEARQREADSRPAEAARLAEQALALTREARGAGHAEVGDGLARVAGLFEQAGDFGRGVALREEAVAWTERHAAKPAWRLAEARLNLAFARMGAGLEADGRARLARALVREQEAARLEAARKVPEAEAACAEALAVYRGSGPDARAAVARTLHLLGRIRMISGEDAKGEREAAEEAVRIRREVLPGDHPDLGRSLNNLGLALRDSGDTAGARDVLMEAVAVWRRGLRGDDPLLALGLSNLGDALTGLQDYREAQKSYEEALALRRKALPQDHPDIAQSLYNLGNAQYDLRDYAGARKSYEEALALRRKALPQDHPDIAQSLYNLGNAQYDLRDYAGARKSHEEALAIQRKALPPGHPNIADSLNNLGNAQYGLGDYAGARKSHEEALALRRKALPQDHPDIAQSLYNLGNVQSALRDYAGARKSHEEALALFRRDLPQDHPNIANSLNSLGAVQSALRDYAGARKSHEEALAIQRKALPPGHPDIATSLNNLGAVQSGLGDYAGARKSHEEALALRRKALPQDHPHIATSLSNLGVVQHALRDYAGARKSYEEALAIFRKALPQDHPHIATSLSNLGVVQHALRDYAGARKSQEEALALCRKALPQDLPAVATSLHNLGNVQSALRDYAGARKSYEEALAICRKALPQDHPDIADSLNNQGNVQSDLRDYGGARKSYEEALAIYRKALPQDHPHIATSLHNIGCLLIFTGQAQDATGALLEACDLYRGELTRLALAQAESEQLRAAADHRTTLDLLLSALDLGQPGQRANAYDRVLATKGDVTARQRAARLARDVTDPDTAALLADLRGLNLRLLASTDDSLGRTAARAGADRPPADPAAEARELAARRADLERRLLERSPAYRRYLDRARSSTDAVLRSLPPGTALVDYLEYRRCSVGRDGSPSVERRLAAFVLRAGRPGVTFEELGPLKPVADLVRRWRARHGRDAQPDPKEVDPGPELRRLVWDPVARHLGDAATVLVSPDGRLTGLPFPALPAAKDSGRRYLLEEQTVVVVPVPQMLPELLAPPPAAPARPSLLLVGAVDFDASPGGPAPSAAFPQRAALFPDRFLAGTREEIAAVRDSFEQAFPGGAARVLRGPDATRAAFLEQAGKHGFLHLATHGYFAAEKEASALAGAGRRAGRLAPGELGLRVEVAGWNPGLLSGVCFAGARRSNAGLLTALDAAELDLRGVRLVTLSACETGLGEVAGGEGVLGLQRAFQVAGARSTVATLWSVDDRQSRVLMSDFYENLWSKKLPVGEALRQAQLRMLKEGTRALKEKEAGEAATAPPYYWAGFVLSGDWR